MIVLLVCFKQKPPAKHRHVLRKNFRKNKSGISTTARRAILTTFAVAAQTFSLPFKAVAWAGNIVTSRGFSKLDKTAFGRYIHPRCYRIGGPSFVTGDAGYIGYALEQGSTLQLSGALATLPAHMLMALIGDKKPLILDLIDKLKPSSSTGIKAVSKLRAPAAFLVKKDHYVIPAAWALLAYNGFSLAAAAITKPVNTAIPHFTQQVAALTNSRPFMQGVDALTKTAEFSQVVDILARAPEFMQGVAILTGCLCLASNQYLDRSNAKAINRSDEKRAAVTEVAERLGDSAIGMLTCSTLLTLATGIADLSPSLLFCSSPAFYLGNYCQHKMRQAKTPVSTLAL